MFPKKKVWTAQQYCTFFSVLTGREFQVKSAGEVGADEKIELEALSDPLLIIYYDFGGRCAPSWSVKYNGTHIGTLASVGKMEINPDEELVEFITGSINHIRKWEWHEPKRTWSNWFKYSEEWVRRNRTTARTGDIVYARDPEVKAVAS